MKIKLPSILSVLMLIAAFTINSQSVQAQAATSSCKCALNCKCRINGECKCGNNCKCAQVERACQCSAKENPCKCGTGCKCKQSGDKSQCKCGDNCQCAAVQNSCKCGTGCMCKQTGDKSQCKCGDNCQCHTMGDMAGMDMEHNHSVSENPFLKMMDVMMVRMDSVPLTGSVEYDFLAQMIPHHQAAVEMAKYEIANGKNFELIQLAKSILAEQQGEIMDMIVMLKSYPAGNGKINPAYKTAMDKTMEVMMKNTPTDLQLPVDVDCCFAVVMLPHHKAAVDMAVAVLKFNSKSQVAVYAQRIIGDQQIEIEQMSEYVNKNCKK